MLELNIKVIGFDKGALLEAVRDAVGTNFEQQGVRTTPTFGVNVTVSGTEKTIDDVFVVG
jgi:hypothetical protein